MKKWEKIINKAFNQKLQFEEEGLYEKVNEKFQTDQEVLSYLSAENHNKLSTILSTETSGELTTYINDPEISDEIYDGPIPLIHEIHTGWYGINNLCADMEQEMDNIDKYRRWDKFKDLLIWKIDGQSTNQFPANVYVERHEP